MNCRDRQHQIVLFLYNELPDPERNDLRAHLDTCAPCRGFFENERQLYSRLEEDFSAWEVPADLLVACRHDLSEALDRIDEKRAWWRLPTRPVSVSWVRLLESAAALSIGLALGVYVTNQRSVEPIQTQPTDQIASVIAQEADVSNVRIVDVDPVSGRVALAGEMVQPMEVVGSVEDRAVRDLLFSALRSAANPGTRLQVAEFLAQNPRDANVKEVLMGALLNDPNAGVRFQALEGLKAFATEQDVRRALIYTLENDQNPGMRVHAIEALMPLTQEEAMEEVVQEAVRDNPNGYVQMRSLQFVGAGN
jgi:hypothetical protein